MRALRKVSQMYPYQAHSSVLLWPSLSFQSPHRYKHTNLPLRSSESQYRECFQALLAGSSSLQGCAGRLWISRAGDQTEGMWAVSGLLYSSLRRWKQQKDLPRGNSEDFVNMLYNSKGRR